MLTAHAVNPELKEQLAELFTRVGAVFEFAS